MSNTATSGDEFVKWAVQHIRLKEVYDQFEFANDATNFNTMRQSIVNKINKIVKELPTPIEGEKERAMAFAAFILKETGDTGQRFPGPRMHKGRYVAEKELYDLFLKNYPAPPIEQKTEENPEGKTVFGISESDLTVVLDHCLKPEEIAGEPALQLDRIRELVRWFARFATGNANPKWFESHAYELVYYIATNAGNRFIDPLPKTKPAASPVLDGAEGVPEEIMQFINVKCDELTDAFRKRIGVKETDAYAYLYGARDAAISCFQETRDTIATLTKERDQARNGMQVLIDNLSAKSEEARVCWEVFRKAIELI